MSDHSSFKGVPVDSSGRLSSTSVDMPSEEREIEIHNEIRKKSFEREMELCFQDGHCRIDFVLVYQVNEMTEEEAKKKGWREKFLTNIVKEGLEIETSVNKDAKIYFVKIHTPWKVLTRYAEMMSMKMPLAENDMFLSSSLFARCPMPFHYNAALLPQIKDHFTATFTRTKESQGVFIIEDKETFFSPAQRSLITNKILSRTCFEDLDLSQLPDGIGSFKSFEICHNFGIEKLLSLGAFSAYYPLHEGDAYIDGTTSGQENLRHLLYKTWARLKVWYKFQPLDHIRLYFGEKIGIYFTWLGCYTMLLFPAGVVGLIVFLYGLYCLDSNEVTKAICDKSSNSSTGNLVMCPLCDKYCPYWRLQKACLNAKITYLFDNNATVFFAAFMALWATFFHEVWKRKRAEIQYDWDVSDFEQEETLRPEFEAVVRHRRVNPVTKIEEPHLKMSSRICRLCSSCCVVIVLLCVVVAAVLGVILYRVTAYAALHTISDSLDNSWIPFITSISAACLNLLAIIILGYIYRRIATFLTDFELPRTATEWENSFTLKMFLFEFVNNNASLLYIALIKGKFVGRPGAYNLYFTGQRRLECDLAGCLNELSTQLVIIMLGKQVIGNFKELLLPMVQNWYKAWRMKAADKEAKKKLARWEKDYIMLPLPLLPLFDEYLEMVIQFGFVTIFVAAFPLAPLFAFLNNIVEIRLDAYKFVTQWQRPLARRAENIGIWFGILQGISQIAVISNAFIIAFTAEFIPRLVYNYNDYSIERGDNIVLFTLSKFRISDFSNESVPVSLDQEIGNATYCWYRGFYNGPDTDKPYQISAVYWHILAARLAFVISFVFAIHILSWFIALLVPDIPNNVKLQMLREKHLANEAFITSEQQRVDKKVD